MNLYKSTSVNLYKSTSDTVAEPGCRAGLRSCSLFNVNQKLSDSLLCVQLDDVVRGACGQPTHTAAHPSADRVPPRVRRPPATRR